MLVTIFPHSWPSSCGKQKIHHSRLRRSWWIFYSPRLLTHSWGKNCDSHGNLNVPFVIHREFLIPSFAALLLMKELFCPNPSSCPVCRNLLKVGDIKSIQNSLLTFQIWAMNAAHYGPQKTYLNHN